MNRYKFCFDLDGTICYTRKPHEHYSEVKPIPGSVETLQQLKEQGHYIIIMTARNMLTHNNNVGKVIAAQASIVTEWLNRYKIPFDELHFGKPLADFYVDDKGIRLNNWQNFQKFIKELE
jgi:capsule biosynthesis phosphatase